LAEIERSLAELKRKLAELSTRLAEIRLKLAEIPRQEELTDEKTETLVRKHCKKGNLNGVVGKNEKVGGINTKVGGIID